MESNVMEWFASDDVPDFNWVIFSVTIQVYPVLSLLATQRAVFFLTFFPRVFWFPLVYCKVFCWVQASYWDVLLVLSK